MPFKPKQYCLSPGCNRLVEASIKYCSDHKQVNRKQYDSTRGTSTERGYNSRWQVARLMYLREHPLCVECSKSNVVCAADVVDHIEPHKGNMELFWNESNWQSLCIVHHNSKTGKEK